MERIGIEALGRAVRVLGGQKKTARVVGVVQQTICACLKSGRRVPDRWCIPLERATAEHGKMIPRADFRPDLFNAAVHHADDEDRGDAGHGESEPQISGGKIARMA